MLYALGSFIFKRDTLAPDNISGQLSAQWPSQNRYQGRPAVGYTGVESETLTLAGVIYPLSGITGTATDIQTVKDMALTGESYVLIGSDGYFYGEFGITGVSETRTHLNREGRAQKIEFEISLIRTDDDRVDRVDL